MSDERKVKQKVLVATTPELAFEALTKASELREWFSDQAWTEVQVGGRYALHWNQGYHVEGKFATLDPPHRAVVRWWGTDEPGKTTVEFTVNQRDDGAVEVAVVHGGLGPGDEWDKALEEAEKGWAVGLENLKSTLETGVDLRIARQPFMGIIPAQLDAERAAKESISVEQGIYINGTLEDTGAQAAGLVKGDVIVALGGIETPDFQELTAALQAHRAGDEVNVELVHGQERRTIKMTLGQRPQADVPESAEGLSEFVAEQYEQTNAELRAAVEGLTEKQAEQCPDQEEWSVKQVLAHLTIAERDFHHYLANLAVNGWLDSGQGNPGVIPGRLAAVQATSPTLQDLLDRYFVDEKETVALLRGLPEETMAHKARFYRIGQFMAFVPIHTRDHIEQIQGIVKAVRGS